VPEGDTIHRAAARLRPALVGEELVGFAAPRLRPPFPAPGLAIERVEARGKHLLVHFGDELVLHTHMRMSGSWHVLAPGSRPPRGRAVVTVRQAVAVCRRAPVVEVLDLAALRRHPGLRRLGPDLTVAGVDLDEAVARVAGHAVIGETIGDVLLDQRPASGIGNVIMNETCFLEGLHPTTPVEQVDLGRRRALYATAHELLLRNVALPRRTTVPGARPGSLWVYDRGGRPCRRCGTAVVGGRRGRDARATWWCPSCQPAPLA
jgi:endonuclease-8